MPDHELEQLDFPDRVRWMLNAEDVAELLGIGKVLAAYLLQVGTIKTFSIEINGTEVKLTTPKELRDYINHIT